MIVIADEKQPGAATMRAVFFAYATAALLFGLLAATVYVGRTPIHNLFDLPFYVGQSCWRWIGGYGLSFLTYLVPEHIVWMRAARMPVATLYATAAILYLGPSQVLFATLIKVVLVLLPVLGAARLVLRSSATRTPYLFFSAAVLALPFLVPAFLADLVNLQAEEGYAFAFLAIAFTLVALGRTPNARPGAPLLPYILATAAALDMLYLSKSSMILAVLVLFAFALRRPIPAWERVLLLLLVAAAPVGWAMRQHAVSGRYTVGTSYDGANFYKGNYEHFLAHYPPAAGENLDFFTFEVEPPAPLGDEWEYNDWSNRQAIHFIMTHPRETLMGWEKKAYVFLISLRVYGNGAVTLPPPLTLLGMVLFRLLIWTAIGLSLFVLCRGRGPLREIALLYLAVLVACMLPYIAGFGYTRHASVLLYPSAVAICLLSSRFFAPSSRWSQGGALPANG